VLATIEEEAGAAVAEAPAAAAPPKGEAPARAPARGRARAKREGGRARATPRVRHLARQHGIDLKAVGGSGPGGRITEADVMAAVAAREGGAPAEAPAAAPEQEEEHIPLTGIRRTIAQRMAESVASAPHALLVMECDVSELVRLRESTREKFRKKEGIDLTYLPFVIKAAAESLREHPMLNASWGEDKIVVKKRIHINIAVATEQGLQVPVVRDADRQSIVALAKAATDLAARARAGKLRLEDVQGGTFTVDNTGAFGSVLSVPIINLGQAAILTTELITKRPVVVAGDKIAVRSMMNLCLSLDHRIVDGAQAGAFLQAVKGRLEALGPKTPIE
jgi:2-oxoisovalerate dehydrogenase E2 component (dihydrolipoyl transacylase)